MRGGCTLQYVSSYVALVKETARSGTVGGGDTRSGQEHQDWVPHKGTKLCMYVKVAGLIIINILFMYFCRCLSTLPSCKKVLSSDKIFIRLGGHWLSNCVFVAITANYYGQYTKFFMDHCLCIIVLLQKNNYLN